MESGTYDFGRGNLLRLSTVGHGQLAPSAIPEVTTGTVTWKVEAGEGLFEGASGFITANFTLDSKGAVVDNQIAYLILK